MLTITLDLIKKNRVYYKCINERGYEVKLKITPKSENLSLGKQELLVNDISVRSKYGVDVIYELEEKIEDEGVVTLKHPYNADLVNKCRDLGGRWDGEVWVFSKMVEDRVEELEFMYNSNIVTVEITAKEDDNRRCKPIPFCGYTIAKAFSRDGGAKLGEGVSLINGWIGSGGSHKNWSTEIKKGSVFRLKVSKNLLDTISGYSASDWDIKII